jgi:uncharacterized protein YjbI with pentapeptide repeats
VSGANLHDADLRADLTSADLSGADLTSAILSGADLTGATVGQYQLDQMWGTNVKLDPDLTLKPCPASGH